MIPRTVRIHPCPIHGPSPPPADPVYILNKDSALVLVADVTEEGMRALAAHRELALKSGQTRDAGQERKRQKMGAATLK